MQMLQIDTYQNIAKPLTPTDICFINEHFQLQYSFSPDGKSSEN